MDPQELNKVFDTLVSNCPELEKVCETWGNQHMLTIAMEENRELNKKYNELLDSSNRKSNEPVERRQTLADWLKEKEEEKNVKEL